MKWFKRCFWLAAWGVWLWCGFGLYRELPRDLGPVVCRLPVESTPALVGFVGDSNEFVLSEKERFLGVERRRVVVADAESGSITHELKAKIEFDLPLLWPNSLRRGLLFFWHGADSKLRNQKSGLHLFDVRSRKWKRLTDRYGSIEALHPSKPWIVVSVGFHGLDSQISVVDYQTGKQIFARPFGTWTSSAGDCFFILDRDELAIPICMGKIDDGGARHVEIWDIEAERLKRTIRNVPSSFLSFVTSGGRAVFGEQPRFIDEVESPLGRAVMEQVRQGIRRDRMGIDVLDLATGQYLLAVPPAERPAGKKEPFLGDFAIISASGRSVLRSRPAGLFEVGNGRTIWRASNHELLAENRDFHEFVVFEYWNGLWPKLLPNQRLTTCATRDMDTGMFLFRTTGEVFVDPQFCNASKTLVVLQDGSVHRLPLPHHWSLLALCQTILALPLVLLWAFLRYRQRRAARRQPAEANLNA